MAITRAETLALRGIRTSRLAVFSSLTPKTALIPELRFRRTTTSKSTAPAAPIANASLLAAQRLRRPLSPHLAVYDAAQTWFGSSIWTRITGTGFSALLYLYAAAYLVAPLTGWHLETASLAAAFGALPVAIKGGLKFLVAWPFAFHLFNGIRHLVWDTTIGFAKSQIRIGGWAIWGLSLVTGLYLGFLV